MTTTAVAACGFRGEKLNVSREWMGIEYILVGIFHFQFWCMCVCVTRVEKKSTNNKTFTGNLQTNGNAHRTHRAGRKTFAFVASRTPFRGCFSRKMFERVRSWMKSENRNVYVRTHKSRTLYRKQCVIINLLISFLFAVQQQLARSFRCTAPPKSGSSSPILRFSSIVF